MIVVVGVRGGVHAGATVARVRRIVTLVVFTFVLFVGANMAMHVTVCGECEMAIFAFEWAFACVDKHVSV